MGLPICEIRSLDQLVLVLDIGFGFSLAVHEIVSTMAWTNDHSLEFIDLYRKERILWDPKHPQNKNRTEIAEAWLRIQSCMNINCSVIDLKKKKESLMTSFRFHWHRKKKNPHYRTTWFAYNAMEAFLCDKYECDSTNELEDEFFNTSSEVYSNSQSNVDPISCQNTSSSEKNNTNIRQHTSKAFSVKRNSRNQPVESKVCFKDMNEDQKLDEYDLYGQLLAKKLRKLEEHQRDVAMHEIDNIMFRAKMHGVSSQIRSYTTSTSPVPRKMKSPIFIVTQQNQTEYEDENISYPEHNMQSQEPS